MLNEKQVKMARLTAAILCMALLAACRAQQPHETTDNLAKDAAQSPPLPIVEPPFDRARMMFAVARAASAHATRADDSAAQRGLDGKQFEVRLRFGCDGQGPERGDHGWSVDPDGRTLRLRAVPTLSLEDEMVASVAGDKAEAAEGFWLPRPWLLQAACPAGPPATQPVGKAKMESLSDSGEQSASPRRLAVQTIQRIGIAQFFTSDDSRTGRRMERPFEAVKQLKDGERAGQQGFNIVLSGRLRSREDGRVILCVGDGRDRPPDCIVSADIDRVRMERPEDKAVIAEWSV